MTMDVLKQTEGQPERYVADADYAGDDGAPGTVAALWQRIESYIARRWHERPVTWVICGSGDWTPPLVPATVQTAEVWHDGAYHTIDAPAGPLGYVFAPGTYRITATVGEDADPPAAVLAAFDRLLGYVQDESALSASVTRTSLGLGNGLSEDFERPPTWMARSLQYSGAADMLRPYRRA